RTFIGTLIGTLVRAFIGTLVRTFIGTLIRAFIGTLVRAFIGTLVRAFIDTLVGTHLGPVVVLAVARMAASQLRRSVFIGTHRIFAQDHVFAVDLVGAITLCGNDRAGSAFLARRIHTAEVHDTDDGGSQDRYQNPNFCIAYLFNFHFDAPRLNTQ